MKPHKIIFILSLFLLWGVCPDLSGLGGFLSAQTTTQNYIYTVVPTIATTNASTLTTANSLQTIQYFDGLGRPMETVQKGITPSGNDLITCTEYDGAGREYRQWLPAPAAGNNGAYVTLDAFKTNIGTQYGSTDQAYAFAETILESSPLNRVEGVKNPGAAWNAKPTSVTYGTNASEVKYFYANGSNQLIGESTYLPNTLYKTTSKDEDGKQAIEYKDKLGRVVMQRRGTDTDTYYVYNDLGQQVYVLPPLAADALGSGTYTETTDAVNKYAYVYKYDERGNCIYKKLPGCTPIYMVYDKADRLILSQDGNQRQKTPVQWTVTKYDVFGRVAYTGTMESTTSQTIFAGVLKDVVVTETLDGSGDFGYTEQSYDVFPSIEPLTVNYYDNYAFIDDDKLNYEAKQGYSTQYTPPSGGRGAAGLLTGTRTYLLDASGSYTVSAMYYDDKGRVVQSRSTNHLGGYDIVYNELDFTGKPNKTLKEHGIGGQERAIVGGGLVYEPSITELYTYFYDQAGRVTKTEYTLNDKPMVVLSQVPTGGYDELGRLKTKKRHGGTDTESFEYNIRNWTTKITSGTFQEQLFYNTLPTSATSTPCFNGNISYSISGNASSMPLCIYNYSYDNLNRLTGAVNNYLTAQGLASNYNEIFTYDKMGNINTLTRTKGNTLIDLLIFTLNGNQIKSIYDAGGCQNQASVKEYQNKSNTTDEMSYDPNGNMVKDLDREITSIQYNILNLPDKVVFASGNEIQNLYDAGGRKLKSRYLTKVTAVSLPATKTTLSVVKPINTLLYTGSETNYIGNLEYETEVEIYSATMMLPTYTLARIYNPEGYVTTVTNPVYYYFRRDHLGNNREVWRSPSFGGVGEAVQRTQYYPSGLPWADGLNPATQNKKYNGKEFIEAHGLDETDLGNRGLHHAKNRFDTMDRFCEKFPWQSPYVFAANNPVNYIDVNGDSINVSEQNREAFNKILSGVYGDNAKNFSYSSTGMLVYNGETKSMSEDQKGTFDGMNKIMGEEETTSVVFSESYTVGSGENAKTLNTSEFGGALTAKDVNVNGVKQNFIVISPSIKDVSVPLDGIMDVLSNNQEVVKQNMTTGLFHEFGEIITTNLKYRGGVIDYENKARRIIEYPIRPYDLNHSKTVPTIYKKKQ